MPATSFTEFVLGFLVGALFIWQGRRIARSPENTLDPSASWHTRSRLAGFVPIRSSSVHFMRRAGIFITWLGIALVLFNVANCFHPSDNLRIAIAVTAAVITFFVTPKERPRLLPDGLWAWQRNRQRREQQARLDRTILSQEDLRERMQHPTKHPSRRLRRENTKLRERQR